MQRRLLAGSILGVGLLLMPNPVPAQEPVGGQAVFKSGVDLVTVSATVRDRKGRLVTGLQARDFDVIDRGERRVISQFRTDRAPISLAILFDISGSMDVAARFTAARFAAHHLLSWLDAGRDEAGLFVFDSRLREVAPFTVDTRALTGALGEVDPFGAPRTMRSRRPNNAKRANPRRAVVVLTDGDDNASRMTPGQVSAVASSIDVPVYVIATVLPIDDPNSIGHAAAVSVPRRIGTVEDLALDWRIVHYASGPASASKAAKDVIDELRSLYLIGFEPGTATGWHPLEIRTKEADHTVRARGGYSLTTRH
jgi:Ca-activated chloride channel family protein